MFPTFHSVQLHNSLYCHWRNTAIELQVKLVWTHSKSTSSTYSLFHTSWTLYRSQSSTDLHQTCHHSQEMWLPTVLLMLGGNLRLCRTVIARYILIYDVILLPDNEPIVVVAVGAINMRRTAIHCEVTIAVSNWHNYCYLIETQYLCPPNRNWDFSEFLLLKIDFTPQISMLDHGGRMENLP